MPPEFSGKWEAECLNTSSAYSATCKIQNEVEKIINKILTTPTNIIAMITIINERSFMMYTLPIIVTFSNTFYIL